MPRVAHELIGRDRTPCLNTVPSPLDVLRRVPFLADVPDDMLLRFAQRARWRTVAPGETVVDAGDAAGEVFLVVEGAVRVVQRSATGHELILNDIGPGEIFGELAAIDGVCRSANVTALLRSRLCAVPADAFMELVLQSPPVGRWLLQLLAARLRLKDLRSLEAASLPVGQRVLAELLRLSRRRSNGDRVVSPPPLQEVLAARLGLRRETVSRELAKLARAGFVTVSRRSVVLHRPDEIQDQIEAVLRAGP